jgi:hypothetical protein
MTKPFADLVAKLPADVRARIDVRTKELVAEELVLRELRKAVELTQVRMGELLGIGQDGVSRIEKRCDMLVSTLRGYVAAMGGRLRLLAELPGRPVVELMGLSGDGELSVGGKAPHKSRARTALAARRNRRRRPGKAKPGGTNAAARTGSRSSGRR